MEMYFKLCKCFISCSSKTISQLDFYASLQHLSHSFMPLSFFRRLRDIMSVLQSATHSIFFITVEKETKLLENQRKITREGFFFHSNALQTICIYNCNNRDLYKICNSWHTQFFYTSFCMVD